MPGPRTIETSSPRPGGRGGGGLDAVSAACDTVMPAADGGSFGIRSSTTHDRPCSSTPVTRMRIAGLERAVAHREPVEMLVRPSGERLVVARREAPSAVDVHVVVMVEPVERDPMPRLAVLADLERVHAPRRRGVGVDLHHDVQGDVLVEREALER